VHSDAEKVSAAQAKLVAQTPPPHRPRERPAPLVLATEALVLVETKRDLAQMQWPFASGASNATQPGATPDSAGSIGAAPQSPPAESIAAPSA
jgi:hypothetical protein